MPLARMHLGELECAVEVATDLLSKGLPCGILPRLDRTIVAAGEMRRGLGNLNVVMINVTSRDDGLRVLDRIEAATETGEINVEDVAMVYKNDKGKVKIQQTVDATAGKGAVKGGGLGLLVGIFAAPLVPAVAVGAGIGALVGKAHDRGISDELIEQAGQAIETSGAVVFVLADQANSQVITKLVDAAVAGGAKVEYQVLSEDAQDLLRIQLKTGGKVAVGVQVGLRRHDARAVRRGHQADGLRAAGRGRTRDACSTG